MNTTLKSKRSGRKQKGFYQRGLHTAVLSTSFDYQGKYCIYGLASSEMPNIIQYIGYTSQKLNIRYNNHINERHKTNPKQIWINSLLDQGHKLHMIILEDGIRYFEQACEKEEQHIETFRLEHPLTNVANGGPGTRGMKHSTETRKKQSSASKNKPKTDEHKRNISVAQQKRHQRAKQALKELNKI